MTREEIIATIKSAENLLPVTLRAIAIMSDHQLALLAVSEEYRKMAVVEPIRAKRLRLKIKP